MVLQLLTLRLCLVAIHWLLTLSSTHRYLRSLLSVSCHFNSMALAVSNLCVSRKIFLKHLVYLNKVCGTIPDLPWLNI